MDWLNQYAWIGALLFARLGAVLMIAPVWGEQAVPATMRLALAVLVTAVLAPGLAAAAPPQPANFVNAIPLIISEKKPEKTAAGWLAMGSICWAKPRPEAMPAVAPAT